MHWYVYIYMYGCVHVCMLLYVYMCVCMYTYVASYIHVTLEIQSDCEASHPPTLPYFASAYDNNETATEMEIHDYDMDTAAGSDSDTLSGNYIQL